MNNCDCIQLIIKHKHFQVLYPSFAVVLSALSLPLHSIYCPFTHCARSLNPPLAMPNMLCHSLSPRVLATKLAHPPPLCRVVAPHLAQYSVVGIRFCLWG